MDDFPTDLLSTSHKIPRISLARLPTPLIPLRRFCAKHKLPLIWLKRDDLTDTAASGNKLRKLEFVIGQALKDGATTLLTCGGVQSNHCRSTAIICAQLGLRCHLILRGEPTRPADGNLLLNELVGAQITYKSATEFQQIDTIFSQISDQYRQMGEVPYAIPVGASDEVGVWGYIEACHELKMDFASLQIDPGYIVSATGSGGTAAGLILGSALYNLNAEVFAFNVCDDQRYFERKISADFEQWQTRYGIQVNAVDTPINIVDGYVGPGYGKAEQPVFDIIQELASTEGMILDPVYTAKAFHGLVSEIRKNKFKDRGDIVFVHTGGIFGLFPQKEMIHSTTNI